VRAMSIDHTSTHNTLGGKIGATRPESMTRCRELHRSNSWSNRSMMDRAHEKKKLFLDQDHSSKFGMLTTRRQREREATWSYGTSFARGGVTDAKGPQDVYVRDPHTGVWFKDFPAKTPKVMDHLGHRAGKNLDMIPLNRMSSYVKLHPM